ncbi:sporulation protein YtfJ [Anoxybacter fermentans]|uniref:Sporulation protein YtfJ n=1 Tax=Anoxybacter fermentans TaxID=1323375 RepID=A0A3Q9HP40_9FIRM|nr:GerW family sporulation protein [Anoxybacter fermentans]AZR72328.1 sporulation protein YtfJ [Anoxybacter fermentans]
MANHPIEALMSSVMENIKGMVDVNTIVGDPVETVNGEVIIPISRVSFGFAVGGGDYIMKSGSSGKDKESNAIPFGGGSGAGVSLSPVAFLVVGKEQVRLLPVTNNAVVERLINTAPELIREVKDMLGQKKQHSGDKQ